MISPSLSAPFSLLICHPEGSWAVMVGPLSWLPLMVQPRPGVGVALGAVGVAVAFVLGVVGMFMLGVVLVVGVFLKKTK